MAKSLVSADKQTNLRVRVQIPHIIPGNAGNRQRKLYQMELMPSRDGWRDFLCSGTRSMLGRHPILNVANAAKTIHTGCAVSGRPGKQ
ncbi:MAG: hypothetical protein A2X81_15825 [Desulfobacterales bacterium GWB2_56_26]|nr:MAG: hypothetical protein A2X81_15825 [Desulfobacterales bacterium GWB2_56_26]